MNRPRGSRIPRPRQLQRGVIILPSAFTLGNLFFGMYAMVATTRGDLEWAAWFIVWAGVLDLLDGRVARFTRTGSKFGAELDSLVDAISFGVAPAFIMYEVLFSDGGWSWTFCFFYVMAVVVRLARYNIEQAGRAKRQFNGLPSPAGGLFLATYYPFSQTAFYQTYLGDLPWEQILTIGIVLVGVLLVSHVPYPVVPRIGLRTRKGLASLVFLLTCLTLAVTFPRQFLFPLFVLYATYGLGRSVLMGLLDRLPERDPLEDLEEELDEADAEIRTMDYTNLTPNRGDTPGHSDDMRGTT